MELHNQALKYLQQNTKRCVACGEGQFEKLLGKVSRKEERKKTANIDEMFDRKDVSDGEGRSKLISVKYFS